ncbi:MAG: hypothetical protein F6K24_18500, partial [Okeania sp. SIO2D1]|nr:hypothetical protein [Okeania sp. SIO2D1]
MNYSDRRFWYERYVEGQNIEVWREIVKLDQMQNILFNDEMKNEVNKILYEMMVRVRKNVEEIVESLKDLNYQFM